MAKKEEQSFEESLKELETIVKDIRFLSMPKRKELWNNRFDSI